MGCGFVQSPSVVTGWMALLLDLRRSGVADDGEAGRSTAHCG
jgi:hypothetical protein